MKRLLVGLGLFLGGIAIAQDGIEPIGGIKRGNGTKKMMTKASSTVDSLVVFSFDTLQLPVRDEFSRNNFAALSAQPGDPGVSETPFYLLTDLADVPLAQTVAYTTQITKRRTTSGGTTTETNLPSVQIKRANFQFYPINYSTITVFPPYTIYDTLDFVNDPDTVYLSSPDIFQDTIRIFYATENDPNKLWVDKHAYHNYTHALNPWTLGVVTFDGVDENGYPYAIGTTTSGIADYLTSKVIDLSGHLPSDSIYLSFLMQSKGLGDEPEVTDSIMLQFYDLNAGTWNQVWGMKGSADTDFKVGHVRINSAQYLTNGFRFRFVNVGGLSGMLDEFHLDYVNLRQGSGYQDTLFKDFAFVYPIGSLIETYSEVPWEHWVNDPTHMNSDVKVTVRNGSNISENNLNGTVIVEHAGIQEGSFTLIAQDLSDPDLNYLPRTVYTSFHDFTGGYSFSTTPTVNTKTFDVIGNVGAQFPNLSLNDSSFTQQVFENVYAYDDGSAESAYFVLGAQARMAVKFTPYQADTLLGVRMCFVPTVNDASDKLFLLTVWADNNGVPGAVLYEDEFFYPRTPFYEEGRGVYTDYILKDTRLPLDGTSFYVGWRQIDADRLNIGFDRNNNHSDKVFYSVTNGTTWNNATVQGVPMIRPIIQTSDNYNLNIEENSENISWQVYPNPTQGNVYIQWDESKRFPGAKVVDSFGRIVCEITEDQREFDLSNVSSGLYFIQLNSTGTTLKIIR